jgi:hypothetical protein
VEDHDIVKTYPIVPVQHGKGYFVRGCLWLELLSKKSETILVSRKRNLAGCPTFSHSDTFLCGIFVSKGIATPQLFAKHW